MEPLRTTTQWKNNIASNFCKNPFAKYPFFQLLTHHPSRKSGARLDRVVRTAGTLLSPTLCPQALPCAQRTLTTNDPKMILK